MRPCRQRWRSCDARLPGSMIFDLPMRASGYYHDMTRTWSLGYATDEVTQAWEQCKTTPRPSGGWSGGGQAWR